MVAVGKLKERYWHEAQQEYLKRLSRFAQATVRESPEERLPDNASAAMEAQGRVKEGERILSSLPRQGMTIALDLAGVMLDSQALADRFRDWQNRGISHFVFVVGGSTGLSKELVEAVDVRLCLSKMTFPHQMARIIVLEQIYRAMKINANEVYHK